MSDWFKNPWWTSCSGKKKYKTFELANQAGIQSMFNDNYKNDLYIYECDYCKEYHLTSKETNNRVF
jgi:hypothetical protein